MANLKIGVNMVMGLIHPISINQAQHVRRELVNCLIPYPARYKVFGITLLEIFTNNIQNSIKIKNNKYEY